MCTERSKLGGGIGAHGGACTFWEEDDHVLSVCVCVCARVEVKNLKLILVVFLRRRCRVCFSIERFQHQLCMLTEKNW